jgi:hypothetical protein
MAGMRGIKERAVAAAAIRPEMNEWPVLNEAIIWRAGRA